MEPISISYAGLARKQFPILYTNSGPLNKLQKSEKGAPTVFEGTRTTSAGVQTKDRWMGSINFSSGRISPISNFEFISRPCVFPDQSRNHQGAFAENSSQRQQSHSTTGLCTACIKNTLGATTSSHQPRGHQ